VIWVDRLNRWIGKAVMLLVFVMAGILLYSAWTKNFSIPPLWAIEMAQFTMTAYYLLGGAYALQIDSHVRMDLAYSRWSPRTKAAVDAVTVLFLLFYLGVLLAGAIASTQYALKYNETFYSSWAPPMAPIKIIMCVGIVLMLLQTVAVFFRNVAEARGKPIP
jgi:TRAP-type mannitol/chloroaromatic compound transport system permease small subunit